MISSSPATNPPTKIYKQLDSYLATNMQEIIPEFEAMNERYKSKYIKNTNITEFEFGV